MSMLGAMPMRCITHRGFSGVLARSTACVAPSSVALPHRWPINVVAHEDVAPSMHHRSARRAASSAAARAPAQPEAPSANSTEEAAPCTNGNVIYSNPELYEAAFSYRDFKQEARFIWSAYKKHSGSGGPPRAILDLGCGPAAHALLLAVSYPNLTVVGLEKNADMLAYAQKKLDAAVIKGGLAAGSQVLLVQGDMREPYPAPPPPLPAAATNKAANEKPHKGAGSSKGFGGPAKGKDKDREGAAASVASSSASTASAATAAAAPATSPTHSFPPASPLTDSAPAASGASGQYDMVMCLLGTLTHMLTNRDAAAALRQAGQALRQGGLLLLELPHPGDLFDGTLLVGDGGAEVWEVPMGGAGREADADAKLMVEWGADFDAFDPVTQVLQRTVSMNLLKGDEVVQGLEEVVPARQFTVQEMELLAAPAGLEIVTLYGDMAMGVDLSHEEAHRMVVVLKKV